MKMSKIVVVGASLAGLNAVETFRRDGYDGKIFLVGSEKFLPYDRPPLSKQVLTESEISGPPLLRTEAEFADLDVELHLGETATHLNVKDKTVVIGSTSQLKYDGLIISTGAFARPLKSATKLNGIHLLRNFEDAVAIHKAFRNSSQVVIIGAGFIGSEVASSARAMGLTVTILESLPVPLTRVLGTKMGSAFASIHGEYGVDLKCNVNVVGFEGSESVERVKLADGSTINADLVVIGVGAIPSTQWLENSGLNIDNGVICDEYCAASESGIYAAGDVARWWHPKYQKHLRVEHWSNAVEQGVVSAGNMLKEKKDQISFSPVPYFWSQQYGKKMQFAGHISESDQVEIQHGSVKQQEFLAIYHDNEKFSGVLAFGFQRLFLSYRKLLAEEGSWSDALELARSIV